MEKHTKEHPILFSGPLVRAILDDRKTQTRRLIRSRQPKPGHVWNECLCGEIDPTDRPCLTCSVRYGLEEPKYKVGDRLWVRETFGFGPAGQGDTRYRADDGAVSHHWHPSIHMPRWASRIDLEVTEVRVQRVQDISEEDARAEGVHEHPAAKIMLDAKSTHVGAFLMAWNAINGARPGGSWEANSWVWAVSFKRVNGGSNV